VDFPITIIALLLLLCIALLVILRQRKALEKLKLEQKKSSHVIQRMIAAFDAAPFICCLVGEFEGEDVVILDVNKAVIKLLKIPDKRLYLDRFFDYCPEYQPDGKTSVEKGTYAYRQAFEKGSYLLEWVYKAADGELIPVEEYLERLEVGGKRYVITFTYDLRDLDKFRKAESFVQQKLNVILDSSPLACCIFDRESSFLELNTAAKSLFQINGSGYEPKSIFDFTPKYQPCGELSSVKAKRILSSLETSTVFEWMHKTLEGELIICEIILVRIDIGGREAVISHIRDLREYKKMLSDIDYRDKLIRAVSNATAVLSGAGIDEFEAFLWKSMGMIGEAIDVDRVYIFKNYMEGAELFTSQQYEWSPNAEPQQGTPLTTGLSFKNFPDWEEKLGNGQCINGSVLQMPEATQKWMIPQGILSMLIVPIFFKGEFWGFLGLDDCHKERVFSDNEVAVMGSGSILIASAMLRNDLVLSLIASSASLEDALVGAQAASHAKSIFLSSMSHEMRTPLTAILGMTAIGKSAQQLAGKDYAFDKIDSASTHLLGVINNILDISKIETGKFELYVSEFPFEKMLRRAAGVVDFRVEEKHQKFSIRLDQEIPFSISCDEQKLTQVITNLLANAVKFTPEGGGIRLKAQLVSEENGVLTIKITVADTGIGVSPEQQAKIFTPFDQASSDTTYKYGGTGLGLSISKSIVELMGGEIWVESELGKGAAFIFTVKVHRGSLAYATSFSGEEGLKGKRVLAVDDDPDILVHLKTIIERFGAECDTAESGRQALDMLEANAPYHICFVDWKMPEIDGLELSRRIRAIRKEGNIVIIMISNAKWVGLEDDAQQSGVDGFLLKPLLPSDILDCMEKNLFYPGATHAVAPAQAENEKMFEGYRLLLAEDVEINSEIVQAFLEPTGIEIDWVSDGRQAVDAFSKNPDSYDVILMDFQMPEMDGLTATRLIRALESPKAREIPIIALTANVFKEDIEKCIEAGMSDHLGKPIDLQQMLDKLGRYLPGRY